MDRPSRSLSLEFASEDQARDLAGRLSALRSPDLEIRDLKLGRSHGVVDNVFILDLIATISLGIGTNLLSELIYAALRGKETAAAPVALAEAEAPYSLMIDGYEVRCRSQADLERLLATASSPVTESGDT